MSLLLWVCVHVHVLYIYVHVHVHVDVTAVIMSQCILMCFCFCLKSQDVRLLLTKFMLLVGEDRLKEYVDVGVEMLLFFFRQYYDIKDIRGTYHHNSALHFFSYISL